MSQPTPSRVWVEKHNHSHFRVCWTMGGYTHSFFTRRTRHGWPLLKVMKYALLARIEKEQVELNLNTAGVLTRLVAGFESES